MSPPVTNSRLADLARKADDLADELRGVTEAIRRDLGYGEEIPAKAEMQVAFSRLTVEAATLTDTMMIVARAKP